MSGVFNPPAGWKYCADCGKQMRVTDSECMCGWRDPNTGESGASGKDWQCVYEINGARCPLPGVTSQAVTGKGTLWCRVHGGERHYDAEAARELQTIIENPRQFLSLDRWRDELVRDVAAAHPEWNRGDEETRSEYHARMFKIARGLASAVRRRMAGLDSKPGRAGKEGADPKSAATSRRPAPSSPEDLVEDAMDQLGDLTARYEEEGYATEIAQRMAIEHVLEVRARAWTGAPA